MLEVGLAEVLTVSWLPETNHIQWANGFFFPPVGIATYKTIYY